MLAYRFEGTRFDCGTPHRPDRGDDPLRARPREAQRSRGTHDAERRSTSWAWSNSSSAGRGGGMPTPVAASPIGDVLIAIAQIGVALAGFSGLIAAIRTTAPEGWHPRRSRAVVVDARHEHRRVAAGLAAVVAGLFSLPTDSVYRISCGVASLYTGVLVVVRAVAGRRLTRAGFPPRVPYFPLTLTCLRRRHRSPPASLCSACGAMRTARLRGALFIRCSPRCWCSRSS